MAFNLESELHDIEASLGPDPDQTILDWINTAKSELEQLVNSPPQTGSSVKDTLVNIILSETADFGPSPITGGKLSKIDKPTAENIADLLLVVADTYNVTVATLAAGLAGESRFDPNALNPNKQDALPNETDREAFNHTDIGIAQFDGATLLQGTGIFKELANLDYTVIKARALDPNWAIPKFGAFVSQLQTSTNNEVTFDSSILSHIPNGDVRILTYQAYNAGVHGAALIAERIGKSGNWNYGQAWVNRIDKYEKLLNAEYTPPEAPAEPVFKPEPDLTEVATGINDIFHGLEEFHPAADQKSTDQKTADQKSDQPNTTESTSQHLDS